jgi:predicted AlkP superfamily phosphohydrolase/phosphomutase
MSKVLVIGIDSMDSELLSKYIDDLTNFKKLKETTPSVKMESVFPPDSDTAWATIYTGLNPAEHGVVGFVDPLQKSVEIQTKESEADLIRNNTFWDQASASGKKVTVLLPHIAYPPWEVNGIMVSRSRIEDEVVVYPENFNYDINSLNSPKGVPRKDVKSLQKFIDAYKKLLIDEKNFFLKMLKQEWDLFFCYSSCLDAIQHYFWNFCDENDPNYEPGNPFQDVIKDFYILTDQMIGDMIKNVDDDVVSIVLSDHGHHGRPPKLININEILRRNGLIKKKDMNTIDSSMEKFKKKGIEWVGKYNLGWIASKITKISPNSTNFFVSNRSLDLESSAAYVTDLSGIKAYTYGGIKVKDSNNYEIIRNKIIEIIRDELKDKLVFLLKREELYSGKYISKYPDLLLQLKDGYGLGNNINTDIITEAYSSNIVPGSHRRDSPIFFITNSPTTVDSVKLEDISPTILDALDLNNKNPLSNGKSILKRNHET